MTCYVTFSNLAGVEQYRFTHDTADGRIVGFGVPEEVWRRMTKTSPVVDGEFEIQSVKAGGRLEVILRLIEATWPAVEGKRIEVRDAATVAPSFLVTTHIDGVSTTWRAYRPDITAPNGDQDVYQKRRTVTLSFPVQPNPTVTGI